MQQIFIHHNITLQEPFSVTGEDVKHITQVLRMKAGEKLRVSTQEGDSYLCEIISLDKSQVDLKALAEMPSTELQQDIYLFQAIPKGDRMDTVIEKAVELGVREIIPVEMKHCVVKLDDRKKTSRVRRYQAIAEAAAKQSKRSRIPQIHAVMTYQEAADYAKTCDLCLVPYECKKGMDATAQALAKVKNANSISIMIGPEGGFSDEEIAMVENEMDIISLGSRILRTDTAAITAMSMVMLACEL